MSDIHYSSRPYRSGDEDAINELYFQVTGRRRSASQWAWQWQQAPAGPGDIWLIEATHSGGRVELIGHHGIMPVRFTWGDRDLLFGKTENTMVLPEYRRKILYPRLEKKFAAVYESRYHALLSTMGPAAAIRQRKAMGYAASHHWLHMEHAVFPFGTLARFVSRGHSSVGSSLLRMVAHPSSATALPEGVEILSAEDARGEAFLSQYWSQARSNWGVAPSRYAEDLTWRYWNNPYAPHYAVIVRHPAKGNALVVLEQREPGVIHIVDFSADYPDPALVGGAVDMAMKAAKKRLGTKLFFCRITDDALPPHVLKSLKRRFNASLASRLQNVVRRSPVVHMPRIVTSSGKSIGLEDAPWNVTLAVSEGRK